MKTALEIRFWLTIALVSTIACCSSPGAPQDPDGGLPDGGEPFVLSWPPLQASLTRPRVLGAGADLEEVRAKLTEEPYRSWMQRMAQRVSEGRAQDPDDHLRGPERIKANAARALAAFYLLDWTVVDGAPVPFASEEERQAAGAEVAAFLRSMYTESRIAVPPPVGGWDRDITTSEEIIMWASAYDTLVGAGYSLAPDEEQEVQRNLIELTSALYENYRDPATASGFPLLHQNNHRAKVGCAFITAAMVLAEHTPDPGDSRALEYEDPSKWAVYGFELLERILEYSHLTQDGVYSEGPFYFRYTSQNLLPMSRAWDRWVQGEPWPVAEGIERTSPWRDPRIVHAHRWMLDVMLPDGSLAPYDDGNVGRRHYYGLAPAATAADAEELQWAWALSRESEYLAAPYPYPSDGNIELAPDAIFDFDDSVTPRAPAGSPTRIYENGGVAVFRSGWAQEDVVAVVLGEHGVAASFGRGPDGDPVFPDSHEHADPGSFMLYAYGERLMLDPGYLDFSRHFDVNRPEDHNVILVGGRGPVDYVNASLAWGTLSPDSPPPADGMAYLRSAFDSSMADGVTVTTQYGAGQYGLAGGADIERRFVFASNRYLVIADHVVSSVAGASQDFTWRFHGNGGGELLEGDLPNLGTFERADPEARWHRDRATVLVVTVSPDGPMSYAEETRFHEPGGRNSDGDIGRSSHTAWDAIGEGSDVTALSVVFPYPAGQEGPAVSTGDGSIVLVDGTWRAEARIQSDGTLLVTETDGDQETLRYAERGDDLQLARLSGPGRFVEARSEGEIEWYLSPTPQTVSIEGLPFAMGTLDGACEVQGSAPNLVIRTGGGRFGIRAEAANGRPAAVAPVSIQAEVGETVVLDGSPSCDPEDGPLNYAWSLRSAPAGSRWLLADTSAPRATMVPDVAGTYRVALQVMDSEGQKSDPAFVSIEVPDQAE
ncbi:MAG: heparinase II/III family protein [Polyangiales bacterium]